MSDDQASARSFEAFNARFLSAREVASTFVPPPQYDSLLERNHSVLLGPRGSGKTTLLKMLQLRSLAAWNHERAPEVRARLPFHSVFLGTDVLWGSQLESRTSVIADREKTAQIRRTSFRLHLALAFLNSIEEAREPAIAAHPELARFAIKMDRDGEAGLADSLASIWHAPPATRTLLGIRTTLQSHLTDLLALVNRLRVDPACPLPDFAHLEPIASVVQAIDLVNRVIGDPERRWAILCDELEIAPEIVRTELFATLRSITQPITFKFSFFPYSSDLKPDTVADPNAPTAGNDYTPLNLTYGHREAAYAFCEALLRGMVRGAGGPSNVKPEDVLGDGWFDGGRRNRRSPGSAYGPDGEYAKRIQQLLRADPSFGHWFKSRRFNVRDLAEMKENEQATFRKALPSILVRSEFLRTSNVLRPRKSRALYTGAHSMFSLTEGNPRIFINLMRPLVDEYVRRAGTVGADDQARSADLTIHRFQASLSAIPTKKAGSVRSILHLVRIVGDYFESAQLHSPFNPEPPGAFEVDDDIEIELRDLVGRALNAGALVRIETKAGPTVGTLTGARLRLAFTLAPEHKLPLSVGRQVNLSTIMDAYRAGLRKDPTYQAQPRLAFGPQE
jgi:hypothetical protein